LLELDTQNTLKPEEAASGPLGCGFHIERFFLESNAQGLYPKTSE
jgi:hypothetical protein